MPPCSCVPVKYPVPVLPCSPIPVSVGLRVLRHLCPHGRVYLTFARLRPLTQMRHHSCTNCETACKPNVTSACVCVIIARSSTRLVHWGHDSGPASAWRHQRRESSLFFVTMAIVWDHATLSCQERPWDGSTTISILRPRLKTSAVEFDRAMGCAWASSCVWGIAT